MLYNVQYHHIILLQMTLNHYQSTGIVKNCLSLTPLLKGSVGLIPVIFNSPHHILFEIYLDNYQLDLQTDA